jgi:hypothetical protein
METNEWFAMGAKLAIVAGVVSLPDVPVAAQGELMYCYDPPLCNGSSVCAGFNNEWVGSCTVRCQYSVGTTYAVCSGT